MILENAQKECTRVFEKTTLPGSFSLHAVGHMIRFLLPVAEMLNDTTLYAAALDDAVCASLCLMLEHDKGLVLKSLHSTWDLRSRSWQGMVSHFWIAVAIQGCWTLGNTPNHLISQNMSQHLRPSFYAARHGIRSVVMPRAAFEGVAAGVSSFFWHLTWTSGARDE